MDATPWREYRTGDRVYYVNRETKESRWTMPNELRAHLDAVPDTPAPIVPAGVSPRDSPRDTPPLALTPAAPGRASPAGHVARLNATPLPVFASYEEAEESFLSLLHDRGIQSSWTWEQTIREIVTEPRYKALKTLDDRKSAFNKYIADLRRTEEEQRREKESRMRPAISRALASAGGLKPYASFASFAYLLRDHAIWRELAADELLAQTVFESLRRDVQEKEAARERAAMEHARTALAGLLSATQLMPMARWRDVYRMLAEAPEFRRDARLQALPLPDMLAVFEDHMSRVEADVRSAREREQGSRARTDRLARDAYKALLDECQAAGTLHARSTWASFFPRIRDEPRFRAMLGTRGSSAQDLFYDVLDVLEREFAARRRAALAHVRERHMAVSSDSWDAWRDTFRAPDAPHALRDLSDGDLRIVFDECVGQAERDARDARRRSERRLRHVADDLRYAMRHMTPPLDVRAPYEAVLPRLQTLPEYAELERAGHADAARGAWDKFVRRQAERRDEAPTRARTDYHDLDAEDRKRKEPPQPDPRAVRRRTEYET